MPAKRWYVRLNRHRHTLDPVHSLPVTIQRQTMSRRLAAGLTWAHVLQLAAATVRFSSELLRLLLTSVDHGDVKQGNTHDKLDKAAL